MRLPAPTDHPFLLPVAEALAAAKGFTQLEYVGHGAFKETYRVVDRSNALFAVKLFDPEKCDLVRSDREIDALLRCDSPLIARLIDHGSLPYSGMVFLYSVEEYLSGGTLSAEMQGGMLSPERVRVVGMNIAKAIDHLRERNLVHRDIKPDNIMFRENSRDPVLVDFGLVRDLSLISLTHSWAPQGPCTPFYGAPEQLRNEKGLIGWRTDQFCLGVVLSMCLLGVHPFAVVGMNVPEILTAAANRQGPSPEFLSKLKERKMSWISGMVQPWPIRRYQSMETLLESMAKEN